MKKDPQLDALIARGEDIEADITEAHQNPDPNVKTRIHIDDVMAWQKDARAYLQRKSPDLLEPIPEFAAANHHDVIYSGLRRLIATLKSLVPKPMQPVETKAADFLTPASFITAARHAHPAFRYALVIAGILAIVVIFVRYGVDYATLVFGAFTIVVLMVLFLVFAQAANLAKSRMALPATVLVWSFLAVSIGVTVMLVSSVFANVPLPLRDAIVRRLDPEAVAAAREVEGKIKGFLTANSLPVPGEQYTDEQLLRQYRLSRADRPANFSYPILSGSFVTFAETVTNPQSSYARLAAMKDGTILGVVIDQSCATEQMCESQFRDWLTLVESAFGDVPERTSDGGILMGAGVPPVRATLKTRTGYGRPWSIHLHTESPKAAGEARRSIAIVIATG
jgi:hypothetical protein